MTSRPANLLDSLPHRPPFRFLSRVLRLSRGVSGEALWQVSGEESFFSGHFPGHPIVPGVLIAEALAQLSGLVGVSMTTTSSSPDPGGVTCKEPNDAPGTRGKLAHVDIRFKEAVNPPADILLSSRLTHVLGVLSTYEVTARARDKVVAGGRLTLAVGTEAAT